MSNSIQDKLLTISALHQLAVKDTDYLLPAIDGIQLYLHREDDDVYIIDLATDRKLPWSRLPQTVLDRIISNLTLYWTINQPHNLN